MIRVFSPNCGLSELTEIESSFNANWIGIGPKVAQFEKEFAERCNFKSCVLTDSASNSLYLAIKLLSLKPGTEIILPSFTFISCAQAIVANQCIPIFCDVNLDTQNVSAEHIAPLVNERTGAIMIVHYAGLPVDIKPILNFGIPIIEDCAHAVDTWKNGVHAGAMGDIGVFSFDSMKNLTMGEGGAITAASPTLMEKVKKLRYCGISESGVDASQRGKNRWWETEVSYYSLRHMPNDIAASIGLAQLKKLDSMQMTRKRVWDYYQTNFAKSRFKTPKDPGINEQHSYFTYFIRCTIPGHRDILAKYLLDNSVYTTLRYFPIHLMKLFKQTRPLPNTEKLNEQGLNLPLHSNLTQNDVDKISDLIKRFSPTFETGPYYHHAINGSENLK